MADQERNAGLGPEHVHPSMQPSVEHLAAFAAIAQYGQDGGLKKRKSDGATTFGRGAPGQKRYCPLCKNPDGSPMALAGVLPLSGLQSCSGAGTV